MTDPTLNVDHPLYWQLKCYELREQRDDSAHQCFVAKKELSELQARLAEVEAFNRSMSQSCSTIAEQRDGYKARLASFEEDERDMDPVFHCGCIFDPESKDGNAPPTSECLYHERLRAQLGEANEALAACQSQAGPCIKDAERYRWAMRNGLIFIRGDDCSLEPWSEADIDAAREGGK